MPSQGDIVLIPIPFTDLSSQKRRPVIVISNDQYNQTAPDVVVVAMTSTPMSSPYSFAIDAQGRSGDQPFFFLGYFDFRVPFATRYPAPSSATAAGGAKVIWPARSTPNAPTTSRMRRRLAEA